MSCSPNLQVTRFPRSFDTKYSPLHFFLLGQITVVINATQMTCTTIVNGKRVDLHKLDFVIQMTITSMVKVCTKA